MHVDLRQMYGRKGKARVLLPQLSIHVCPEETPKEGSTWYLCGYVGTHKNAGVALCGHVDYEAVEAIREAVAQLDSQTGDPVIKAPPIRKATPAHD